MSIQYDIKKATERANRDLATIATVQEATEQEGFYHAVEEIKDELKAVYNIPNHRIKISSLYVANGEAQVRLFCRDIPYRMPYDEVIEHATSIRCGGDKPTIHCDIRITRKFNGVEIVLEDYFMSNIPEVEVETLRMLGKVKVEIIPEHTSTTVFCERG